MLTFIFYYCFITEKKRKRKQKESPIISLEVVTALSIMKGDFNMKDLRNPLNRTENFEHPSGNVMKELSESDLNSFSAGAGETRASSGIACTLTAECNIGTHIKFCCY